MPKLTCSPSCFFFFFLITLFFLSIFQTHARKLDHQHCPPISCADDYGLEIRFPFRLQHKSPPNCGYPHPAFQLSCDAQNQTLISLWPSSPPLVVKDIDYEKARVEVNLTNNCLAAFFSNLSPSPFRPYDPVHATVIDCYKDISEFDQQRTSWIDDSCLSSFGRLVYLWSGSTDVSVDKLPLSCHSVKTIEIDLWFEYWTSQLRWEVPLCEKCRDDGRGRCYTKNMTTREMGCHPDISYASTQGPKGKLLLQEIAIGIARGIEYLHQGCDQRILHFDIKPQNILLDENFVPKVSDFGLAKLCSKGQSIVSVTAARGTMGYIAPEVFSRNFGINVSHKSDVYSFGMLLLEMVGGRKKMMETAANGEEDVITMSCPVYFPEWIYKKYLEQAPGKEDRHQMGSGESTDDHDQVTSTHVTSSDHHQVDEEGVESSSTTTSNISDKNKEIARKLSIVGLRCIQWYPVDRPSMHGVVQMLEGSGEGLSVPPNPFINASASNPELQESATSTRRVHLSHLAVINE